MPFLNELKYKTLVPGCLWELTEPLVYQSRRLDRQIIVPRGYVTDFLSLPIIGKIAYAKDGPGKWASVVHDYGFTNLHTGHTRKQVDGLFLEALREDPEKPNWLTRTVFYNSVRFGGERWWQKNIDKRVELLYGMGFKPRPDGQIERIEDVA